MILAGGKCEPALAEETMVEYRAQVPYLGRSMVEIVLAAVEPLGDPILVGGPEGMHQRQIEGGASFVESMKRGLAEVKTETFLLVTVDLPCLTTAAVEDFLNRCDPSVALNYPIISVQDCEREFPGMKRTTLKLKEGEFTGGNLGMMRTDLMHKALPILEKAYGYRKSPVKLAGLVGFGTLGRILLAKFAPSSLDIPTLEKKVGSFLGVQVKAIVIPFAEIGADIDNLSQYKSLIALKKPQQ